MCVVTDGVPLSWVVHSHSVFSSLVFMIVRCMPTLNGLGLCISSLVSCCWACSWMKYFTALMLKKSYFYYILMLWLENMSVGLTYSRCFCCKDTFFDENKTSNRWQAKFSPDGSTVRIFVQSFVIVWMLGLWEKHICSTVKRYSQGWSW